VIILHVEDDRMVASRLKVVMEAMDHEVFQATSAEEARAAMGAHPIDVVIVDVGLKGIETGVDFIDWMRSHHPRIPRVLTSGVGLPSRFRPSPPLDMHLPKPFGVGELMAVLTVALAPSSQVK
jgi:DNA-binding NtrC family response regulator